MNTRDVLIMSQWNCHSFQHTIIKCNRNYFHVYIFTHHVNINTLSTHLRAFSANHSNKLVVVQVVSHTVCYYRNRERDTCYAVSFNYTVRCLNLICSQSVRKQLSRHCSQFTQNKCEFNYRNRWKANQVTDNGFCCWNFRKENMFMNFHPDTVQSGTYKSYKCQIFAPYVNLSKIYKQNEFNVLRKLVFYLYLKKTLGDQHYSWFLISSRFLDTFIYEDSPLAHFIFDKSKLNFSLLVIKVFLLTKLFMPWCILMIIMILALTSYPLSFL